MPVVINSFEVLDSPAPLAPAAPPPPEGGLEREELERLLRQQAERQLRVKAD